MAKDLAYDANGDMIFPPDFVYDTDEIEQTLLNIVLTPLGQSTDETVGLDYDWLLGGFDQGAAVVRIQEALKQDARVTNVDYVDVAVDDDDPEVVNIYFKVQTTIGPVDLRKGVNINALNG